MSFEPRMRGRRFGRPVARKSSAKSKREQHESSVFFEEAALINPIEIRFSTLNSLEHLGNQRFALPPFSEHFQRWTKDVRAVLGEFENLLPQVVNEQYSESIEKTLISLQTALDERMAAETKISGEAAETQRQLSACENELSRLEHDYKIMTSQIRRKYDQSFEKMRREINTIDKQRLRILHEKPTLLQRLFRKSDTKLEEKTNALQSKKNDLGGRREGLKQDLEKHRIDYENKRKQLVEKTEAIRARMSDVKGKSVDDALDLRKHACEELSRAVSETVEKLLKEENSQNVEGTEQTV